MPFKFRVLCCLATLSSKGMTPAPAPNIILLFSAGSRGGSDFLSFQKHAPLLNGIQGIPLNASSTKRFPMIPFTKCHAQRHLGIAGPAMGLGNRLGALRTLPPASFSSMRLPKAVMWEAWCIHFGTLRASGSPGGTTGVAGRTRGVPEPHLH